MHRTASRDDHAVDATPAPIIASIHGEVAQDWRQAHADLVRGIDCARDVPHASVPSSSVAGCRCNDLPSPATNALTVANDSVATEHHGIDPRLPTHMLSAILLNGADYRVIGFRGRSSPGDQCLEALSSVQRATATFMQAAADALRTHADWLGGAAVRDMEQRLQDLGRHYMKPEEPYHLVALSDGSFYAACTDGTLVIRHPNGQQEIRRYHSPQEASAWISKTVTTAVLSPRVNMGDSSGPTHTAHAHRNAV